MNRLSLTVAAGLALTAGQAASAGGFKTIAKELSRPAVRQGVERVAVLPFIPTDSSAPSDGWNISERLITQLVRRGGLKVVERGLLRRLSEEQTFARTGLVDPTTLRSLGRILAVDAVVTGSFVTLGREVAVNARLIIVETGVIAAAVETTVPREWFDAAGPALLAELPSQYRPPAVQLGCAGAAGRPMDLKARYWAARLRLGLAEADFEAGPAASIADPAARETFLKLTRKYVGDNAVARSPSVDEQALAAAKECGI